MAVALILAAALTTGCLQIELTIEMNDQDAGATLTERVRLSRTLLELDRAMEPARTLTRHLAREAAQERMNSMGEGMTLDSHRERTLDDGSRECVTVYRIPDIEDLRLPNPLLQNGRPAPMMRFRFSPRYKPHYIGDVDIGLTSAETGPGKPAAAEPALPAATPLDAQLYRDLQPVFAELMRDFEIRITLILPHAPKAGHVRDIRTGNRHVTLLALNAEDMDRHGERFLANEEAMLALLQFKFGDPAIVSHTDQFVNNALVPVNRGRSLYGSGGFRFRPTTHLYRKFFAGRPKAEGGDR